MQIQLNTDKNIAPREVLSGQVEAVLEQTLSRFADRITRVEVHLTDESSSQKTTDNDKRCMLEARLAGMQPISVSHQSASIEHAVAGAADKLEKVLDRTLQRKHTPKGRTSYGGDQTI